MAGLPNRLLVASRLGFRTRCLPRSSSSGCCAGRASSARAWAVGNATGLGYLLAQQLVAAGERVLDVQPKLTARVRLLATESTNKNDLHGALSVAIAARRSPSPKVVGVEDHAAVMRLWARRHLAEEFLDDLLRVDRQIADSRKCLEEVCGARRNERTAPSTVPWAALAADARRAAATPALPGYV